MGITTVVFQFAGTWTIDEANHCKWCPSKDVKCHAILVDDTTCAIKDVKGKIMNICSSTEGRLDVKLSYMPSLPFDLPRPIYIEDEESLRAYFGWGGPESRPVIMVESVDLCDDPMSELARKHTLSSSESTMEEESAPLPDELITEILVRLPVKSLVRFKTVSKSWYALIRSPNFVNQHLKHDGKETVLLLSCTMTEEEDFILSLHDPDSSDLCRLSPEFLLPFKVSTHDYLDIVGPCNGLFFLSNVSKPMLCNPSLRELKVLPPRPIYLRQHDKEVYNYEDGFGFDPLTGSYKVIGIYYVVGGFREVELYDSRTNCWRMIDSTHEMLSGVSGNSRIFFKGACHWISYVDTSEPGVLCFDVSTEVFRRCELPKWDGDNEKDCSLSILRDRLTLVCYPVSSSSTSLDIWVMEEYGVNESWAQTFKIELNSLVERVFFFRKDEWILVEDNRGGPMCLDIRNSELGSIVGFDDGRSFSSWNAIIFKESLISIDDVICSAQDG